MAICWGTVCVCAQQPASSEQPKAKAPQVRINLLNACSPADNDRKELEALLARVPLRAHFADDFEVDRGRTTTPGSSPSNWVRVRREFTAEAPFTNAQYTFNVDDGGKGIAETLVFRTREMKAGLPLEVSLQNTVSTGDTAAVLASDTPPERIRMERFGGTSVVLARCPSADQSAYEPLFRKASEILASYRVALRVRQTVPGDLARVAADAAQKSGRRARRERNASSGRK
ncbi:MAG: hypothetical protein ACE14M_04635 [Terriglobales bacterium]